MEMETLKVNQTHDQIEYNSEEIDFLLSDSNTWVCERELSTTYLHLVKRYLASHLQVEVIKLEEVDQATYESTNILATADIANERRISSSPIPKQNDDVGHHYGKSQLSVHSMQGELVNSLENYSGCDKGVTLNHSGNTPYSSDVYCQRNLNKNKITGSAKMSFCCDICEKTFKYRSGLNTHKLIHIAEKSFACDICTKTFKQRCGLNKHKLIHSGEKPYACDICGKTFMRRSDLNRHKLFHSTVKRLPVKSVGKDLKKKVI